MTRGICHALAALALLSAFACAPKKTTTTKNEGGYLQVHPESLDAYHRANYNGKRIELLALVGSDGFARLASPLFHLSSWSIQPGAVTPENGYRLMRLRGAFFDREIGGPTLESVEAVPIEVPIRSITFSDVEGNPTTFEGAHVAIEGNYAGGFEASWLSEKIWVDAPLSAAGKKQERVLNGRVRAEGWLFTRGGRFGHMGRGRYLLLAEKCAPIP